MEFFTMFNTIIEDRRQPRDDLASLLANATLENGEPMGLVETLGYYLIVFNAGHDTPATRSPARWRRSSITPRSSLDSRPTRR